MNLMNQFIVHKAFGEGKVIDHTGSYLTILFSRGEKKFVYPDSFKEFLRAKDKLINIAIQTEIAESENQKLLARQKQELQNSRHLLNLIL